MPEGYWLLAMMIVLHIFADFHLQGILANMKQRRWWEKQECEFVNEMTDLGADRVDWISCDNDYIPALLLHAFEWSFIICIPLMWFIGFDWSIFVALIINTVLHAYIDHMKCNAFQINLIEDQLLHFAQILLTLSMVLYFT